jgi:hypothetical protein
VHARYDEDYHNIQQALLRERYELFELSEGYDKNRRPPFHIAREMEQRQKAVNILVDGLKYLDYMIKKEVEAEVWRMIHVMVFILPVLLVLIMLGFARLLGIRNRRRALELLK